MIYDGFLILKEEVRVVWRAKISIARAAYVLNKYSAIVTVALMNNGGFRYDEQHFNFGLSGFLFLAILGLIPLSTPLCQGLVLSLTFLILLGDTLANGKCPISCRS